MISGRNCNCSETFKHFVNTLKTLTVIIVQGNEKIIQFSTLSFKPLATMRIKLHFSVQMYQEFQQRLPSCPLSDDIEQASFLCIDEFFRVLLKIASVSHILSFVLSMLRIISKSSFNEKFLLVSSLHPFHLNHFFSFMSMRFLC